MRTNASYESKFFEGTLGFGLSLTHGCRTIKQFERGVLRPPILEIDPKASTIKLLCFLNKGRFFTKKKLTNFKFFGTEIFQFAQKT